MNNDESAEQMKLDYLAGLQKNKNLMKTAEAKQTQGFRLLSQVAETKSAKCSASDLIKLSNGLKLLAEYTYHQACLKTEFFPKTKN